MIDKTTLAAIRRARAAPTLWSVFRSMASSEAQRETGAARKRPVNGVHCFSQASKRLSYKRLSHPHTSLEVLLEEDGKGLWE